MTELESSLSKQIQTRFQPCSPLFSSSSPLDPSLSPSTDSYLAQKCMIPSTFRLFLTIHRSFFQSACILGYCVTPLFLASLICFLFNYAPIRFILVFIGYLWSNKGIFLSLLLFMLFIASVLFMSQMISPQRKVLAVYPVFLFYVSIALLIFFNWEWYLVVHSSCVCIIL